MRLLTLILSFWICLPQFQSPLFAQCDSTLQTTITYTACINDHVEYNGNLIWSGTSAVFPFVTADGCDSLVTIEVLPILLDTGLVELVACEGDYVYYEGTPLLAGVSGQFTLTSSNGCDSTVLVDVLVVNLDTGAVTYAACAGESINYFGHPILAGESQLFTLPFTDGCDSSVWVSVDIIPADTTYIELSICENATRFYQDSLIHPGEELTWIKTNQFGCDSFIFIKAQAVDSVNFKGNAAPSCPDLAEGMIELTELVGTGPFACSLDNMLYQDSPQFNNLKSGDYSVWVKDANGCQQQQQISVPERNRLSLEVNDYELPCGSNGLTIRPTVLSKEGTIQWYWEDGSDKSWLRVENEGQYPFTVQDECAVLEGQIQVDWVGLQPEKSLFIPNAFTPNGDGKNDLFLPFLASDATLQSYEMQLFDRWGNQLFTTYHIDNGWDGNFLSEQLMPGVYVYFIKSSLERCGQEIDVFKKGDLHLIR